MADETVEISDDGRNDWMERQSEEDKERYVLNGEHVQRSRLRVDTRKWLLSKALPKMFGDKITQELTGKDGGPITTADLTDQEIARRLAFMLAKGVEGAKG